MGMKPIHGDGSEPIAKRLLHNAVSAANEHPSGKWGEIAHNTVTHAKFTGNSPVQLCKELVSGPNDGMGGAESPDHSKDQPSPKEPSGGGGHPLIRTEGK